MLSEEDIELELFKIESYLDESSDFSEMILNHKTPMGLKERTGWALDRLAYAIEELAKLEINIRYLDK